MYVQEPLKVQTFYLKFKENCQEPYKKQKGCVVIIKFGIS